VNNNRKHSGKTRSGQGAEAATPELSSALGNLLPEFWPDFKRKLPRYKHLQPIPEEARTSAVAQSERTRIDHR
jgi:hypothetical protein